MAQQERAAEGATRARVEKYSYQQEQKAEKNLLQEECGVQRGGVSMVALEFGGRSPCCGGNRASGSVRIGWAISIVEYCFLPSFLNDKKTTSLTNEMGIWT